MSNINIPIFNKFDISKYYKYIIGVLFVIIACLIIFSGDDNRDAIKEKEARIKELLRKSKEHEKRADSLELSIVKYKEITKEFQRKDSLKTIEIERQKGITNKLKEQQGIAKAEREEVEQKLKDFKENPPKYDADDPFNLALDLKRRIDVVNKKK